MTARSLPRALHPGAWWLWALGLATAASRTNNLLLLGLIVAVAAFVVAARRTSAPWSRAFQASLVIGAFVIVVRLAFEVVFSGTDAGPTVLVTLPQVPLPDWAAGVALGGPVTLEGLLAAVRDGSQLAAMIVCVGAANALANPSRLLKAVPGALYEVGVAVVVALTLAPQAVEDVQRLRRARRLRGRADRGLAGWVTVALPALEDALERSLQLAASMDARGYGRRADVPPVARRTTAGLVLGGLLGVVAGLYGLLDSGSPDLLGLPLLLGGVLVAAVGFHLASRRSVRTRYRPDPWLLPEWTTVAAGAVASTALLAANIEGVPGILVPSTPLAWPVLPLLPALGVLAGLLPAWLTPPQEARETPEPASAGQAPVGTEGRVAA